MVPIVAAAFLAGLSGAPHCAGMCGPLLAAQARGVPATIGWHVGKALTYAALGVLASRAASLVPRLVSWAPALGVLSWLLLLWFSLRLAGARLPRIAFGSEGLLLRLVGALPRRAGVWSPVALGALVGLLPCGLVYAALALALAAPSAPAAAVAMAAFALGTLPATIAAGWGVRMLAWRSRTVRLAMAAAVLVLGTAAIAHRATLANAVLEDPSVCHGG